MSFEPILIDGRRLDKKFTISQRDYICEVIGDWYILWKDRIRCEDGRTHRLGFAKEVLKEMLLPDDAIENEQ